MNNPARWDPFTDEEITQLMTSVGAGEHRDLYQELAAEHSFRHDLTPPKMNELFVGRRFPHMVLRVIAEPGPPSGKLQVASEQGTYEMAPAYLHEYFRRVRPSQLPAVYGEVPEYGRMEVTPAQAANIAHRRGGTLSELLRGER